MRSAQARGVVGIGFLLVAFLLACALPPIKHEYELSPGREFGATMKTALLLPLNETVDVPDGLEPGDLIEIRLLPDGEATWRRMKKQVLTDKLEPGNPNSRTYDQLYTHGHVAVLCWPDLVAEQKRTEGMSELELLGEAAGTRWAHMEKPLE